MKYLEILKMICENDCRECDSYNKYNMKCDKGKGIMILPFDFETYMNNIKTIEFEKYEDDEYHFGQYDDLESLYIIRMKSPYYVNIKKINEKLKLMDIELKTIEMNKDNKGIYILVEKVMIENERKLY